ncbi:MAG TPA: glycosyltransferase family 4 protein [Candidatus Saccharimonadia bacterium]|jgi:phosphatidylinositol alpha-mannosyltransferase
MTIGFVLDDTLDRPDGVQQYVLTLGTWLTRRGHRVFYLTAHTARTDVPEVYSLGNFARFNFNGNAVRTPLPASSARIRKLLHELHPDVLHVQMPYSPLLAERVIMNASARTAIVGTFHILPLARIQFAANRLLALVLRRSLGRFQVVMAVSPPAADFARRVYGLSPQVVPNAVDLARFKAAPRPHRDREHVTVLFMGRLVERKGVLELIRAFRQLPPEVAAITRLVIGGDGRLAARARNLAGTAPNIEFAGFVPEDHKAGFLAAADIAVFPSTAGESFGIVLVEAIAAGAGVVLAGHNPGYASVLGAGSAALINPADTQAFARRLAHFINNADTRDQLHEVQRQLVSRFDIHTVGPQIEAIYQQVLTSRPTE